MKIIALVFLLLKVLSSNAQTDPAIKQQIHSFIDTLSSPAMHGRGYVLDGRVQAASYIESKFREFHLKPVLANGQYGQYYSFHINTFPGKMELSIDGQALKPGDDYIIDAASVSFTGKDLPVVTVDMTSDNASLKEVLSSFDVRHAYVLKNIDSFCRANKIRQEEFSTLLPRGCYLMPQKSKLTWTVEQNKEKATVFYVKESSLPAAMQTVSVNVQSLYMPNARNENIIGDVPGEIKDSFLVFSAHYDHLGMMGDDTYFPGASDNASGTAMLLYLASWFSAHPQHYSILFISFSGEEAGLLGSAYYVAHPATPLDKIKFLINIDIMGDATDGITVVNATEYPGQFSLLNKLNDAHKYLPVIKSRGKAANSDHYHFTEMGVPSFFIYSNGGKGFYHDIFDVSKEVTLNNVDGVAELIIAFLKKSGQTPE